MVNGPYGMFPSTRYPDPGADIPSVDVLSETGGRTTVVFPASEGGGGVDASTAAASGAEDAASCVGEGPRAASCGAVPVASPVPDAASSAGGGAEASFPDEVAPDVGAPDPVVDGGGDEGPGNDRVSASGDDEQAGAMSGDPRRNAPTKQRDTVPAKRPRTPSNRWENEVTLTL
jgi:hypothetical protein